MEADAVKWFGLLIGLVIVVSAAILAIRQNTTSWQHVFIFALGNAALLQSLDRSRTFSHNAQSLIAARPDLVKPVPAAPAAQ